MVRTSPEAARAEPDRGGWAPGRKRAVLALCLVLAAAGASGLYRIARGGGKHVAHAGACAGSLDLADAAGSLVRGEVAALTLATRPNDLAAITFDDAEGRATTVGAFKDRTVLLNLWATWCVPCRQEMPALAKLQGALGSAGFAVVPVNIDTARLDRPRAFLKQTGAGLPFYADHTAAILQQLKARQTIVGLPTTILIGRDGCEIGTMAGPAQWDSPDARALIEALAKPAPDPSRT